MSEDKKDGDADWSVFRAHHNATKSGAPGVPGTVQVLRGDGPALPQAGRQGPEDEALALLKGQGDSLIARIKANSIKREAALEGLREVTTAQTDVLRHYVQQQVAMKKTWMDNRAKEFLQKLDAEHLRLLGELDVKNMGLRASVLEELNDKFVAQHNALQKKSWPPELITETLEQLVMMRKKIMMKIIEDFSERYKSAPTEND